MGQRIFRPKFRDAPSKKFNGRKNIDRMYDNKWERYRARFLKENRKCYRCNDLAEVVDHLESHMGNFELFTKLDNHIPLCARCHNTATTLFDRNRKSGDSIAPKIKWLNELRDENSPRVKVLPSYEE